MGTSQEVVLIAELGNRFGVPILSLANEVPVWASLRWPFLINAARSQLLQMKAIAAIVQSCQWRRVNIIYEDNKAESIIPHLFTALQEADAEINELLPLPPEPPSLFLSERLMSLRNRQSRVFIVHTSATLAKSIFREAKKLEMMEEEYVWITTDSTANFFDTFNTSIISSMQGALGVKSYIANSSKRIADFRSRFQVMFRSQFPEEQFAEPGISSLQAYDAMWAVVVATEGRPSAKRLRNSTSNTPVASMGGRNLLARILASKFEGLTGPIYFKNGMLHPAARIFSIVNVVGVSTELGYWTEEHGFSKTVGANSHYNKSIGVLRQIIWPGGPWSVPRGWASAAGGKRLRIVVPSGNNHKEFVNVSYDGPGGSIRVTGFVIDVFNATLARLPYALPCDFIGYDGLYETLVYLVYNQTFDAAIGDTAILANRSKFAEFSQPFTEPGIQMVVYENPKTINKARLFMKPFTGALWISIAAITVYNGFVVSMIERKKDNPDFRGSRRKQIGTMLSTSFITLFSLKGEGLHSNLSRMVMVAWLFLALVTNQTFTANLSSLITLQQISYESLVTIDTLRMSNAKVGCDADSFVGAYLRNVFKIQDENIVGIRNEEEYATALVNGSIGAAFLEIPYIKAFMAKHCKGFTASGPIYKVGGFGFVFPKNSPYIPDISQAVVNISETLMDMLQISLNNSKCSASKSDHASIGIAPFIGPFLVTFGTSSLALFIFYCLPCIPRFRQHQQPEVQQLQQHDPRIDEQILFASEMENQAGWQ
ncbi:unnamed protein product [Dovyalis caffra]|uniref:Glutamate receptor n=1 Tax=Dovyalis caffra TaxID=77055 RepID=A0AAV1QV29_9ROSI|nr:unnamed protein product [Dovyalis caffra]